MALYGAAVKTDKGTRRFVIDVENAEQALSNINDLTGSPKASIQVFMFEDMLREDLGSFAELTRV